MGNENQAGHIDANGQDMPLMGQVLNIGTQQRTRNVVIGRIDPADPEAHVTVNSALLVGNDMGQGGRIDAALDGGAARNLEIGHQNTTADVHVGRAGQTIDMFTQTRMNSNAIVMNDAANIVAPTACGIVFNEVGHGFGRSLDFVINSQVVGWADAQGIHVQPQPVPAP